MSTKPAETADTSEQIKRAERALERVAARPPIKKDDPASDRAEMEGSVLQPLAHSD